MAEDASEVPKRSPIGENISKPPLKYTQLLSQIQEDPYSNDAWKKTVSLARSEDEEGFSGGSFYDVVPLGELIEVGEKLRAERTESGQYQILSERSSSGKTWYDIVLGHVNDQSFVPITQEIQRLNKYDGKYALGLDLGTGTGNTLRAIAPSFERVVGIDRLGHVLQKEKDEGTLPENSDVIVGDVGSIPLEDNSVDIAVSNGLTFYLSKDQLPSYARELFRVLKPGGRYMESFTNMDPEDPLPKTEMEYLRSAKGLLTCLLDNMVTIHGRNASDWSFNDMVGEFAELGFGYNWKDANEDGIFVMNFFK